MGKMNAKSKSFVVGLLALVMLICGFLAFSSGRDKSATAATETAWLSANATPVAVGDSGAIKIAGAAIIVNETNILELPNRTATFQMKVNKSAAWSGMAFLNGLEAKNESGEVINSWKNVTWPGINAGVDTLPHLIFQNNGGQFFGNTIDSHGGIAGVTNPVQDWSSALVGVELHIGTGKDNDLSYIKVNGTQLASQTNSTSVLATITTEHFPNGCYLGMHLNMDASSAAESYFTEFGSPIVPVMNNVFKNTIKLYEGLPKDNLGITVSHLSDLDNVVFKINGELVDEQYYTVEAGAAKYPNSKKFTIKQAFWSSRTFPKVSYFTIESSNGKAVVLLDVMHIEPPVWTSDSYLELDTLKDVSFDFSLKADTPPTSESIQVFSGVYSGNVDKENSLTPNDDYILTSRGEDAYTLTIKQSYLEEALANYYGRTFIMQIGEESISSSIYLIPQTEGWITRPVDIAEGGEVVVDDFYTTMDLTRFVDRNLVPRVYYNRALDVTQPIVMEADFSTNAFDNLATWVMLQVMDDYSMMDYFSDNTKDRAKLAAIFFGGRTDLQKLGGFATEENESTNANYTKTSLKKTVIELYFGANENEPGYFRINGVDCGVPAAKQGDFKNGKAYIGWFIPRSADGTVFKVNTNVNSVVVSAPVQDSEYTMDLSKAEDFTVTLQNAGANITIKDDKGNTLTAGQDYTYDQASQKLVLKAGYFSGLPFTKKTTISVWDSDSMTGTQFSMNYTASAMQDSTISFVTLDAVTDAIVALPDTVTSIRSIMTGDTELTDSQFSFADGKLTIKSELIPNAKGSIEFIVTSQDGFFYPVYVYVDAFKDGGVKLSGNGTFETDGKNTIITQDLAYELMEAINFKNGATFKIDFKSTPGYYQGGLKEDAGRVTLEFYDLYSGLTLVYNLYTNYEKEAVTASNTALFESYSVVDAEGNTVVLETVRAVNIDKSKNPDALGAHSIKFEVVNGKLNITVDNARSTSISDLGGFNLSGSICTVKTSAGSEDAVMNLGINYQAGIQDISYNEIKLDEEKDDPTDSGDGCSSCNSGSAMAGVGVLLAALVMVIKRR